MVLLARLAAGFLVLFAATMMLGTAVDQHPSGDALPLTIVSIVCLGGAGLLIYWAQKTVGRAARIEMTNKLVALAQATGTLTVVQVTTSLSVTPDEANAALTRLKQDGIATFDVDEAGAPIYRVQKLNPPR